MTISDELETLIQTKKNIKAAITNKGVSIPSGTPFADYPNAINAISGESGSFVDLSNYVTKDELEGYATKDEMPTVPTDVSAFNNDVGYLTEHQSLEGYATEDYVGAALGKYVTKNNMSKELNNYVTTDKIGYYATKEELQNTIGDINTVLDVINGEIIPDDTEEVNTLLDDINGEVI